MCKWWDKMTGNHKSSAKVVDGSLILSLPDALTPVVWRMELGNAKASALEVRDTTNGSQECFNLVLKKPQGDTYDIASYGSKAKAVRALVEVSEALEKAPTPITDVTGDTHKEAANSNNEKVTHRPQEHKAKRTGTGKWVMLIFGILIVSGLGLYLNALNTPYGASGSAGSTASSLKPASGGTAQTGVPLSADDFLRE